MSKVYGYCRVALANDEEMAEQLYQVYKYCKDNELELHQRFYDNGASGLSLDRKGLNDMLSVLQKGDVVVTKDISRFARDLMKLEQLVGRIYKIGAEIVYIDKPEDNDMSPIENWIKSRLG